MRKCLSIAILLFILVCPAYAELPCECGDASCRCFIQLGDEGMAVDAIQNALTSQGYLPANKDASSFDESTLQAVIAFQTANNLPPTGMMDDATLTLLLWGMLPEELDAARPDTSKLRMWIPTDGGIRHHNTPTCSKMYDPRMVTQRNALAMNMLHCGRCKPDGYHK